MAGATAGSGDAVHHLAQLVAFDTTSDRPNEPLIAYAAGCLAAAGVAAEVLPAHRLTAGGAPGKAALIARFGPDRPGGVVLSGHTDTVPVEGQPWTSDPFRLRRQEGRLIGRGTADMKGFIAAVLAAAPALARAPLARPVWLALSYDEEVGCLAAPALIDALLARAGRLSLAIVGEPSGMRVAPAHRGINTYTTTVIGRAGHSGDPASGANAIVAAADLIGVLARLAGDFAADCRPPPAAGHPAATLNVGRIVGGSAVNMIAGCCRFDWECRPQADGAAAEIEAVLAQRVADRVLPRLRSTAPEARIDTEKNVAVPPLTAADPVLIDVVKALAEAPELTRVPFASEAGFFQRAGVPALICGPGDPAQAHQADEHVALQQLDRCGAFLHRLASWLANAPEAASEPLASLPALP